MRLEFAQAVVTRDAQGVLYDWSEDADQRDGEGMPWFNAHIDAEGVLCIDSAGGPMAVHPDDAIAISNDLRRLAAKARRAPKGAGPGRKR